MPLPWKKSKSSRISRFVSDLQQSPKHGGSLFVETGFPTSLIDLFVKNRDRLKKSSSKRINKNKAHTTQTQTQTAPTRRRVSSTPPPPSLSLQRRMSLPLKLDPALVTEDPPLVTKIEESFVPAENRHDGDDDGGGNVDNRGGGGCCVLMVVVFKVFMVAVLALSTKKLAVGITLSAFTLLFLELAVARVFRLLNLCPDAQIRIDSLIEKLIGKRHKEKLEEEEEESTHDRRRNKVSFEIIEEPKDEIRVIVPQSEKRSDSNSSALDKPKPVAEEEKKEVQTIRDVVFKNEKSKSAKLKSKIVKKIVPKKLRSYKKKKKMKNKAKEEEVELELELELEEEGSVTEVSSLYSEERMESEISERDDVSSNPPLLESCTEIEEEEEEEIRSKGDLTKVIGLIVIVLVGLLSGKVFAIGLTLSWCLILRVFCCKSQTSL